MKHVLRWFVLGSCALVAACGGGLDEAPVVAPAVVVPARAGAADIGPAGGSVDAVLEGGTTVELTVPAGALAATTTFRLEPQTPSGSGRLAAFRLTTDVETFLQPATLVMTLAPQLQAGPEAGLVLQGAGQAIPLGRPLGASRRISAQISFLPPAATPARSLAAYQTGARATARSERGYLTELLEMRDRFGEVTQMIDAILRLQQQGSVENAVRAQYAVDASNEPPAAFTFENRTIADIWQGVVCGQQSFSTSALNSFNGVDVPTFRQLAYDSIAWTLLARTMNTTLTAQGTSLTCSNVPASFRQPVMDKLPDFITRLTNALNLLDPRTEYVQLLDVRLPEVLALEALMQQFDLGRSVLNLLEAQMVRMRRPAFEACQQAGDQDLQRRLLTAKVGNPAYTAVIPYSEADIRQDIEFCGMPLRWQLLNENRQAVDSGSAGGVAFGDVRNRVEIGAVGTRFLVLQGPVRALMCSRDDGSRPAIRFANNEQLVARVGPETGSNTEVARLTPSNEQNYLQATPLEFDLNSLRSTAAAIQPSGAIRLQLQRSGDFCGGTLPNLSSHAVLASLILDFVGLSITTTALPDAEVGKVYSAVLAVRGGRAPYTWSASGLPSGLMLDQAAGTIQGLPTVAGTFPVALDVRSSDGQTASASATLIVKGNASGVIGVDHNAIVQITLPSGPVNCPATRVEDFGTKTAADISASCAGQSGESAVASLSFSKSFAGSDLVGVIASASTSVRKGGEFDQPNASSQFVIRFTVTRTTQLAIDTPFTLPMANAGFRLQLGRDGFSVYESNYVSPIKETLTLLPGRHQLVVHTTVFNPVDAVASAGFSMRLAFGP